MEHRAPACAPSSANQSNRAAPGDGGWLRRRRTWLVVAGMAVIGAFAFGWFGLYAAALSPLLLSLLPCAVMCALGLCMAGRGKTRDRSPAHIEETGETR